MFRNNSAWENEIIQAFSTLIPYLPHILEEEITLGITDRMRYIHFVSSDNMASLIKEGDIISPDDAVYEALRLGTPVVKTAPPELYGPATKAIGIPVKDINGRVIGGLSIIRSSQNMN